MSGLKPGCVVYRGGAHNDLDMAAFDQVGKTLVVSMAFQWNTHSSDHLESFNSAEFKVCVLNRNISRREPSGIWLASSFEEVEKPVVTVR
jgi:hypothetical protein